MRWKQYTTKISAIIHEWISSDSHIKRIDALNLIGRFCAPVCILHKRNTDWENRIKMHREIPNKKILTGFKSVPFFLDEIPTSRSFVTQFQYLFIFCVFLFHHKQKRASRCAKSQYDTDPSVKLNDVREIFSRLRLNIPWYCCCCCSRCSFYFFFFSVHFFFHICRQFFRSSISEFDEVLFELIW